MTGAKLQVGIMEDLSFDPNHRHNLKYSDISAKEDNSFRNHIRQPKRDFLQVPIENRLIRSGCCPIFKDNIYKTVKSTL